ncbi:MAG: anthranilate phosphoribosyltransferase [Sulfuritalea sp.]|jgi:anthranilate phosphoribosyltransferase|nr:anthranilate phosphoribosyltransferase [Polynucleobacter sp.]MCF8187428.1 anthranilate phosphoribosyltransferase [Sulfuritalea sp.]
MTLTPQQALLRCIEHREIFHDEMLMLFRQIMGGEMSPVMIAALTMGLRVKKETIGEIAAAAQVMREFAAKVDVPNSDNLVDIVGTGGDGANTFNISTASMFVVAAAGARVAKHGGRSVSSSSGSADALEALGVNIQLKPEQVAQSIQETGIGFMFAPNHHAAMKHAAPVRKELGVRTIFNILGPLTNPAGAPNIMMGVFHADLVGIQARVLQKLGAKHALVVWARDNMDEVSLGAATMVGELVDGEIREYDIHPEDFGLQMTSSRNLRVDSSAESVAKIYEALDNKTGAARDIVILNSGTALYASGVVESISQGVAKATESIASGAARAKLEEFAKFTRQFAA